MKPSFTCIFCLKNYSERKRVTRHLVSHLPWYFGKYICYSCKYSADRKDRLDKHCATKEHLENPTETVITRIKIFTLKKQYIQERGFSNDAGCRELQYRQPEAIVGLLVHDNKFNTVPVNTDSRPSSDIQVDNHASNANSEKNSVPEAVASSSSDSVTSDSNCDIKKETIIIWMNSAAKK